MEVLPDAGEGGTFDGGGRKPASVGHAARASTPTEHLELRRPKGQRDRIATPAEAAKLLAVLPDLERALWATRFYSGLRRGELRALRWSDVDLPARVIPRPPWLR